jgi:hypothetical protein
LYKRGFLISLILSIFILQGCIVNNGGKYELFTEQNQKIFDFSTPGDFTYTASEVDITSSACTIAVNYNQVDDFADATTAGTWTSYNYDGFSITTTEASNQLSYDCDLGTSGMELDTPLALVDHTVYVETTPATDDGGNNMLTIIGRYQDSDNFYRAITDGTNHYITRVIGGFSFTVASAAITVGSSLGTTYKQKFKMDGYDLYYKVWESTSTEPSAWAITTSDGGSNYASGSFALGCNSGTGAWANPRYYASGKETDYDTDDPTITFPEFTVTETLSQWLSVEMTATLSGSDTIKFDVSDDGGGSFMTYSGGTWTTNGGGYSGALSVSELNSYLKYFPTESSSIVLRAYIHSDEGLTTPNFTQLSLTYTTAL